MTIHIRSDHPRHFARRNFLRGLTATTLAAPFFGVGARRASAQAASLKNLVVVTWPEGLETGWQPKASGGTYEFIDVLSPLNPYRNQLTVIEGIKGGTSNIILQHSEGTLSLWTGDVPSPFQNLSRLPSFEQLVAAKIGAGTAYRSLHFGTQTNRASGISNPYVHYAGKEQPIPAEDDPATMYDLIFGGASKDAAAMERLRAEQKSVLDFVTGRLTTVRTKVAAEDRVKLDKHQESIRSLEKSLLGLTDRCEAALPRSTITRQAAMEDANFPAIVKTQTDLLAVALQCGVTRVATLQLSNTDSQIHIPGLVTKRTVHEAMHSGTRDERVEINRFFAKQLAYVLERLASVDVGPGKTLLDETLVVMSSEMAVGGHWNDPIPFFIAGQGAGKIKLGQYLKLPQLMQHTKPLANIMDAFGVGDAKTFGVFTATDAQGDLAALRA